MRYLSVCSGIEAVTVAWHPLGFSPVAFSEIDKFPAAVLAHHYPHVPNLGDMTNYKEWDIDQIDMLVGGTPCQSFSVAGLRTGLDDPRGNLALVYLGIAERFRPRWLLWENVPGVLSSYTGPEPPSDLEEGQEWQAEETSDFECFTTALGQLGYGWSYRILDAQYFGVPQRRRRVFVVGYLGDWRRAAAVLFERHSLSGDSPPSREKGKSVAALTANDVGTCGADDNQGQAGQLIPFDTTQIASKSNYSNPKPGDPCHPLAAGAHIPAIAVSCKDHGADCREISPPLRAMNSHHSNQNSGGQVAVAFAQNTRDEVRMIGGDGQITGALAAETGMKQQTYVMVHGQGNAEIVSDGSPSLTCNHEAPICFTQNDAARDSQENMAPTLRGVDSGTNRTPSLVNGMQVRRLTPVECERLQGFPDNYTRIPWRNKPPENCPDGPRYKALGNSMAVPAMRWIGERIKLVEENCDLPYKN